MYSKKTAFLIITIILLLILGCDGDPDAPGLQNNLPAGSAGLGKTILIGETVSLEGTAEDLDGDSLSFTWTISSTPSTSTITSSSITSPTSLDASFTPDVPGEYVVQLKINDGKDSQSVTATVKVVGFAIGLNDHTETVSATLHNGDFIALDPPESMHEFGGYQQTTLTLQDGIVYTGGSFIYNADSELNQPVFWTGISHTEVDLPSGGENNEVSAIAVDSAESVQLIVTDIDESTVTYNYWVYPSGYVAPSDAVISDPPWIRHNMSNLFRNGDDIFGIGVADDAKENYTFFLSKNGTAIVPSASYTPDPLAGANPNIIGEFFIRGTTDAASDVYLFGSWRDEYREINAGYAVNGGDGWVTLYNSTEYPYKDQWVVCMASTTDYILHLPNAGTGYTEVYINHLSADMETPFEGDPAVNISGLNYDYIEKIDGSIFVAGGYHYFNEDKTEYNVAAIWRDGIIVYEENDDGGDYNNASIAAADFE